MTRQIFAAEISHDNSPFHIREKLAGTDKGVRDCIRKLRLKMDEAFVLSTPTRFVVYVVGDNINPLLNYFLEDAEIFRYVQFYKNTLASVNHLFAMASGLCSNVKGEHTILTQIREAHVLSHESNGIGLRLDNLLRHAIRVGKSVRTETGIDKFCISVVDGAISLLYNKLENLYDCRFLIIGSGEVAKATLDYLYEEGFPNVTIACHHAARAKVLAAQYCYTSIPFSKAVEHFKDADVIIGAGNHPILFPQGETTVLPSDRKRIILDLGVPRNFGDKFKYQTFTELYSLDDLKALSPSPLDLFGGVEEAWRSVSAHTQEFLSVLHHLEQAPILEAYWSRLGNLKHPDAKPTTPLSGIVARQESHWIKKYTRKMISQDRPMVKNIDMVLNNTQAINAGELIRQVFPFYVVDLNVSPN